MRQVVISTFLLLTTLAIESAWAGGSRLKPTLADWMQRRERTTSVQYTLEGTVTFAKGSLSGPDIEGIVPAEDYSYRSRLTYKLDFAKGLSRREEQYEAYNHQLNKFVPRYTVNVFDGKTYSVYEPREKNVGSPGTLNADVLLEGNSDLAIEWIDLPVFLAHGVIPTPTKPTLRNLRPLIDPSKFDLVGEAVVRGASCILLKAHDGRNSLQYWIDAKKQSAVIRLERYTAERLSTRLDIEYKEIPWGSVPAKTTLHFFRGEHAVYKASLAVTSCLINESPESSSFEIDLRPGMVVRKGKVSHFQVNPSGELEKYRTDSGHAYIGLLVIIIVSLAALLLIGVIVYRRKRAPNSSGNP